MRAGSLKGCHCGLVAIPRARDEVSLPIPCARQFLFGDRHVEAMQSWLGRLIEVHLAEHRSGVAGPFQLAGEGGLVIRERVGNL